MKNRRFFLFIKAHSLTGQSDLLNETMQLVFQNHLYLIIGKKIPLNRKNVESQTFPSKSLQSGCCL